MLEMYSKRPRFCKFSGGGGYAPGLPWKQVQVFSISAFSKAFATSLKPY